LVSGEPENLVLQTLRNIRGDIARLDEKIEAKVDSLRADVAADFIAVNARIDTLRKETGEQIVGLVCAGWRSISACRRSGRSEMRRALGAAPRFR
jgi:hypothetical protein